MEFERKKTEGQKFKINTCRTHFGSTSKEIVIRVKRLSPLKQKIFLRYKNTFISLNNPSTFDLISFILHDNFIHTSIYNFTEYLLILNLRLL